MKTCRRCGGRDGERGYRLDGAWHPTGGTLRDVAEMGLVLPYGELVTVSMTTLRIRVGMCDACAPAPVRPAQFELRL